MRFKKRITFFAAVMLLVCIVLPIRAVAKEHYIDPAVYYYENPDTGYIAAVQDMAWIFSEDQKKEIIEEIAPVTEYGNAFLFTTDESVLATDDFALQAYNAAFGHDSGVMIIEDVNGRTLRMRTPDMMIHPMTIHLTMIRPVMTGPLQIPDTRKTMTTGLLPIRNRRPTQQASARADRPMNWQRRPPRCIRSI